MTNPRPKLFNYDMVGVELNLSRMRVFQIVEEYNEANPHDELGQMVGSSRIFVEEEIGKIHAYWTQTYKPYRKVKKS